MCWFGDAAQGEASESFAFPLYSKEGERIEIVLNVNSRFDNRGAVVGVVGVGQDVTEFTRSQREISQVHQDVTPRSEILETASHLTRRPWRSPVVTACPVLSMRHGRYCWHVPS